MIGLELVCSPCCGASYWASEKWMTWYLQSQIPRLHCCTRWPSEDGWLVVRRSRQRSRRPSWVWLTIIYEGVDLIPFISPNYPQCRTYSNPSPVLIWFSMIIFLLLLILISALPLLHILFSEFCICRWWTGRHLVFYPTLALSPGLMAMFGSWILRAANEREEIIWLRYSIEIQREIRKSGS